MMFDYDVMTEDEATQERYQLLKDGIYKGTIGKITFKPSSSGNPMFDFNVAVYDERGKPHPVRDFLVFTRQMMWKVINCAKSSGTFEEYQNKKFSPTVLENKDVTVVVKIEKGQVIPEDKLNGKPIGSKYPDKNKIENYIEEHNQPCEKENNTVGNDFFDDTIPF